MYSRGISRLISRQNNCRGQTQPVSPLTLKALFQHKENTSCRFLLFKPFYSPLLHRFPFSPSQFTFRRARCVNLGFLSRPLQLLHYSVFESTLLAPPCQHADSQGYNARTGVCCRLGVNRVSQSPSRSTVTIPLL